MTKDTLYTTESCEHFPPHSTPRVSPKDLEHREFRILHHLALEMANLPDRELIGELVLSIAKVLNFDCFFIGRLNKYTNMIRTVKFSQNNKISDNISYNLAGTPCERVLEGGICVYTDNITTAFPRDQMLIDMDARGYVGTPLFAAGEHPIGIMAGVTKTPIEDGLLCKAIMDFFRNRVAYQLEASELLDRYIWAFSESKVGIWDWDTETGLMVVSDGMGTILNLPPEQAPKDISQIEERIHPDDRSLFKEHIRALFQGEILGDIDFRIRLADNTHKNVSMRVRQRSNDRGKVVRLIGSIS